MFCSGSGAALLSSWAAALGRVFPAQVAFHGPRQYRLPRAESVLVQRILPKESCLWVAAARLFVRKAIPNSAAATALQQTLEIQWKAELLCQGQAEEGHSRRDKHRHFQTKNMPEGIVPLPSCLHGTEGSSHSISFSTYPLPTTKQQGQVTLVLRMNLSQRVGTVYTYCTATFPGV